MHVCSLCQITLASRYYYIITLIVLFEYLQNPASGDALTKLQDDIDETKIILVSHLWFWTLLACTKCVICRLLFPMSVVSVCHVAQLGFTVRGSFGAAFAKLLWPLVRSSNWAESVRSSKHRHNWVGHVLRSDDSKATNLWRLCICVYATILFTFVYMYSIERWRQLLTAVKSWMI